MVLRAIRWGGSKGSKLSACILVDAAGPRLEGLVLGEAQQQLVGPLAQALRPCRRQGPECRFQ
eukprot:5009917-Lingulodinium_polyedra.AAC.1